VSPLSAVWALLCRPAYYWRKRAPIEALLIASALGALLFLDGGGDIAGFSDGLDIGTMLWPGLALAASGIAARVLPPKRLGRGREETLLSRRQL